MPASGQLALDHEIGAHVCRPPKGFAATSGPLWICPDCWSEFIFRPVWSWELNRVIDLWVRHYEPGNRAWVPPDRRYRNHGRPR